MSQWSIRSISVTQAVSAWFFVFRMFTPWIYPILRIRQVPLIWQNSYTMLHIYPTTSWSSSFASAGGTSPWHILVRSLPAAYLSYHLHPLWTHFVRSSEITATHATYSYISHLCYLSSSTSRRSSSILTRVSFHSFLLSWLDWRHLNYTTEFIGLLSNLKGFPRHSNNYSMPNKFTSDCRCHAKLIWHALILFKINIYTY